MKRIFFASIWLFLSGGIILAGVGMSQYLQTGSLFPPVVAQQAQDTTGTAAIVAAKPGEQTVSTSIEPADARTPLVQNFLERHKSPLLDENPDFAKFLVDLSDKYNIDFRLLPAIAMLESNLCKVIPEGSYNCLGLGVHKRGTWGFNSYEENFEAAAQILKKNYVDKGLTTPEEIMQKYNPTSAARDGSWAARVNQFIAEMRYDDHAKGIELNTDANLLEFATDSAKLQ